MTTETIMKRPGRGGRYPFDTVAEGDTWTTDDAAQSESIQNSFAAWARNNGKKLRAARQTMPDGSARITFIKAETRSRPDQNHANEARVRILDRQVTTLIAALDGLGRNLSAKAETPEELAAVKEARETITTIIAERSRR